MISIGGGAGVDRRQAEIAAHDAEELLVYAGLIGDRDLEEQARAQLSAAAAGDGALPDASTRAALIEVDPVSAATLGWLGFPELQQVVTADPDGYLYPDEAEAVRQTPADLRLVVLARAEGISLADVRSRRQQDYELAARGKAEDVRRVWEMLKAEGVVDDEPPSPHGS
jgi:hypothetical protein